MEVELNSANRMDGLVRTDLRADHTPDNRKGIQTKDCDRTQKKKKKESGEEREREERRRIEGGRKDS